MWQRLVTFFVPGIPQPGGSKKAFAFVDRSGRPRANVTEDCKKSRPWQADVKTFAVQAYKGEPIDAPLRIFVRFIMPRPKGHFNDKGKLRAGAPALPAKKPDPTKLLRGFEDALTGIVWRDDSLIVEQQVCKQYGPRPGARIYVWKWQPDSTPAKETTLWQATVPPSSPTMQHKPSAHS